MGHALELKTHYTLAEYLEHEEHALYRAEYYQGELFAMAGTSDIHNRLAQNLTFGLRLGIKGGPCEIYIENLKLELVPEVWYVYPDVMLTCDPRDREDRYIKRHPRLLAEILSPGTEGYDRQHKLPRYLQLPTLEALLLVSQTAIHVELFERKGTEWVYRAYTAVTDTIQIGEITLPVAVIYEGVEPEKVKI
ncbi:MAG: Uma2 family endonuclease [Bacteroidia bacterium]|nr:Uma2 family endonuclease [Bacteroidia bacterium]